MKKLIKYFLIKFKLIDISARIIYQIKKFGLLIGLFQFIKEDMRWLLHDFFFDKKLGIDTFNNVDVKDLGISNLEKYANRYQPVSIKHLKISCDFLFKLKNNEYDIFLDIGCGKGKPLFYMANYYPKIKEFIGIDISRSILNIANLNLEKIKNTNKFIFLNKIKFLEKDALKYKFQKDKKYLIFMFNPFSKDYFEKFFHINKNLFNTNNFDFIIVNSPCSIISYLDLIYYDEKNALEIYRSKN